MHAWDEMTPIEEVMRAFDDFVRAGKVLYIGISDAPAWWVARANTLAELRGWTQFIGLQIEYNLIERTPERELLGMAEALGLTVTAVVAARKRPVDRQISQGLNRGKASGENAVVSKNLGTHNTAIAGTGRGHCEGSRQITRASRAQLAPRQTRRHPDSRRAEILAVRGQPALPGLDADRGATGAPGRSQPCRTRFSPGFSAPQGSPRFPSRRDFRPNFALLKSTDFPVACLSKGPVFAV
jgi:hypothetical protein